MEKLHIHKLSEYFLKIEELQSKVFDRNSNVFWFRGQSVFGWDLMPSIYRHYKDIIKDELDRDIIDFRRFAEIEKTMFFRFSNSYIFKKENEKADWRTYFYMQHYNVQTRLLDWTENPLIALFFAIIENPDAPASIFILDPLLLNNQSLSVLTDKKEVSVELPVFNEESPKRGDLLFKDKNGFHIDVDALSYKYFNLDFNKGEKASPLALAPLFSSLGHPISEIK